jgi:hypothetical protein
MRAENAKARIPGFIIHVAEVASSLDRRSRTLTLYCCCPSLCRDWYHMRVLHTMLACGTPRSYFTTLCLVHSLLLIRIPVRVTQQQYPSFTSCSYVAQHYSCVSEFLCLNWNLKQLHLAFARTRYYLSKFVVFYCVYVFLLDANLL